MRKIFGIITLIVGSLISTSLGSKPVAIKFIGCNETPVDAVYDSCLVMDLEGEKKEYAGLEGMHGSDMVFQGKLHDELGVEDLDSRVSVSINDDKKAAVVVINDPSDKELFTLVVDMETGNVKDYQSPDPEPTGNDVVRSPRVPSNALRNATDRQVFTVPIVDVPSQGFKIRLQLYVDWSFAKWCLRSIGASECRKRVDEIIAHARTMFAHSEGFVPIQLEVNEEIPFKLTSKNYKATSENLDLFGKALLDMGNDVPEADIYTMLSYGDYDGTIGYAYIETACSPWVDLRVNIVEHRHSTLDTAGFLVHEIGHNLGMGHDFNGNRGRTRYSKDGTKCTKVGGYMDYGNHEKWTKCSAEDFQWAYSYHKKYSNGYCLPLIEASEAPPANSECPDKKSSKYCYGMAPACRRTEKNWSVALDCLTTCGFCPNGQYECKDHIPNCGDSSKNYLWWCNNAIGHFKSNLIRLVCRKSCGLC